MELARERAAFVAERAKLQRKLQEASARTRKANLQSGGSQGLQCLLSAALPGPCGVACRAQGTRDGTCTGAPSCGRRRARSSSGWAGALTRARAVTMVSLPHDPVRAFGCSGSWGGIEGSGETLSPMAVVGRATGTPTGALGTRQGPPAADSGGGQGRGQEGTAEGRNGRDGMEGGGYPPPMRPRVPPFAHQPPAVRVWCLACKSGLVPASVLRFPPDRAHPSALRRADCRGQPQARCRYSRDVLQRCTRSDRGRQWLASAVISWVIYEDASGGTQVHELLPEVCLPRMPCAAALAPLQDWV